MKKNFELVEASNSFYVLKINGVTAIRTNLPDACELVCFVNNMANKMLIRATPYCREVNVEFSENMVHLKTNYGHCFSFSLGGAMLKDVQEQIEAELDGYLTNCNNGRSNCMGVVAGSGKTSIVFHGV